MTRLISIAAVALCAVGILNSAPAQSRKPALAVMAAPSKGNQPAKALFDSDLEGRDLAFLTGAVAYGRTIDGLAVHAERLPQSHLSRFGGELLRQVSAQCTVLKSVAEMRGVRVSDSLVISEKRLMAKLEKLDGIRLEKALLDAFREADRKAIVLFEVGSESEDSTIRESATQTLPKIRGHLAILQAMAGIAPERR